MHSEIIFNMVCVSGLFMLLYGNRSNDLRLINEKGELTDKPTQRVKFHVICILWLAGFIPLLSQFNTFNVFNSVEPSPSATLILIAAFVVMIVIVSISAAQNSIHDCCSWQPIANSVLIFYAVARVLFLITYEILLRGSVLPILIDATGAWIAILLNTVLYGLLHAFASRKEIIGSLLFGPVLCLLTIQFQALWPAITLHVLLAVLYEGIQLNYHFKSLKHTI